MTRLVLTVMFFLGGSLLVTVARGQAIVYEGFDLPLSAGATVSGRGSGYGFAADSQWGFSETPDTRTIGVALFDREGLSYRDSQGQALEVRGGAVQLAAGDLDNIFSRALETVRLERPETYWVSFLLRWDSGFMPPGDMFWTPDGQWDRGAVGLQSAAQARLTLVNGPDAGVVAAHDATHLLLVRIERQVADVLGDQANDAAQLWVDPQLDFPGPPQAEYLAVGYLDAIRDADAFRFKLNHLGQSVFTVDELRLGSDWPDVLPVVSALPCDFNRDGAVDAADAAIMFGQWAGSGSADCNGDGIVDAADAGLMFASWTGDAPRSEVQALSEPVLGSMAWLGVLGVFGRRQEMVLRVRQLR